MEATLTMPVMIETPRRDHAPRESAHRLRASRSKPARRHKLQRIREAIADGRYHIDAKLDAVLDRVLSDLGM